MNANDRPELSAISICSGIGGLDLAVERVLGARVVALLEREAYAQAVLLDRMEEEALVSSPIYFDVTRFDGRAFHGLVDLVFGGIPCQAHSVAGKQLRSADERDLIDEFLRIVSEVGPRFAFVENVRGFVAGDGLGRLLGGLADLGFDAEWETVQAAQVGAPHRRERVFVLAYSQRGAPERRGEPGELRGQEASDKGEGDQRKRCGPASDAGREDVADAEDNGHERPGGARRGRPGPTNGCCEGLVDAEGQRTHATELGGSSKRLPANPDGAERELGSPGSPRLEGRAHRPRGEPRGVSWPPGPSGDWSDVAKWCWPALANHALKREGAAGRGEETRGATEGAAAEPGLCGVADGLPALLDLAQAHRTDRLRCLGNAVVPAQAESALRALINRVRCGWPA